jgi:cell division protein FtsB
MPKIHLPRLGRIKAGLPISLILLLLFLVLLGRSYFEVKERIQRLELLGAEVAALSDKKEELEGDLDYRRSLDYVEREAREQLGYVKDGEVIVVLPDLEEQLSGSSAEKEAESSPAASLAGAEAPIWRQWHQLFFGN